MYQYTGCGLENVWLANGYAIKETPYGEGVAIDDVDGLHRAIGKRIVEQNSRLTGEEFRFFRKGMGFSQSALGKMFGVTDQTIANWEKKGDVPKMADSQIRQYFALSIDGGSDVGAILRRIAELDHKMHGLQRWEFEPSPDGWHEKAA